MEKCNCSDTQSILVHTKLDILIEKCKDLGLVYCNICQSYVRNKKNEFEYSTTQSDTQSVTKSDN